MSTPQETSVRKDPASLPPPKWWGRYVFDGQPPQRRFIFKWRAIGAAIGCTVFAFYLSIVSSLWGYYTFKRQIPGVHWIDIAIPTRFSRVQDAIGSYYLVQAKEAWSKGDILRALVTGRASLVKSPANLDARLFVADCWFQAGRYTEAVRTLRDGIPYNATEARLQTALISLCLLTSHYADLLAVLRNEYPAQGVHLVDGSNRATQIAEVRAVYEINGAAEADQDAGQYPGLMDEPSAAPLMAQIEGQIGRKDRALAIMKAAVDRAPKDPTVRDAYIGVVLDTGNMEEARTAAQAFVRDFPGLLSAELRFLEVYSSRTGSEERPWAAVALELLAENRHRPDALSQLASLAAAKGWADITYLLYQNSLQENLNGFPFALYYAASLVKAGQVQAADAVLSELSVRNGAQVAAASYVTVMVDWGAGRQSEAMQIVQQLRHDTANDPHRRQVMVNLFKTFGFPKVADELGAAGS
jgi:thioredoxin-like negative regulator of GroEL